MGDHCRCGSIKNPANTFCPRCYFGLPKELRNALYRRIGQGYEEAYTAAVKFLEEMPR